MFSKIVVGAVAITLVACGKTNPAEDHSGLKTVPYEIKSYPAVNQTDDPSPFTVDVLGESEMNYANFVEGQLGTVQFKVTPYPGITSFALVSSDLPKNASLK